MRQIKTLCLLTAAIMAMTSCKKTDSYEETLYGDTAITAFTLGTLNRYTTVTTTATASDGSTTTTTATKKTTLTGSNYVFHIDHVNRLIFNTDSLPVGTDVAHVICSISTMNNGSLWLQDLDSKDSYTYFSSSDSIDFTTPRTFLVRASDNSGFTEYTVKVNVHKEEGEQFVWKKMGTNSDFADMQGLKLINCQGIKYVLGNKGGNTVMYTTTDDVNWTAVASNVNTMFAADAWKSAVEKNDTIFMVSNAMLFKCTNGTDWEQISISNTNVTLKQLVGASTMELYALADDNTLWVSHNNGRLWNGEALDEADSSLPTQDIAFIRYPARLAVHTCYALMAGNRSESIYPSDATAVVWRKTVDEEDNMPSGHWTFMTRESDSKYTLPRLRNLQLLRYDESILAFGSVEIGGSNTQTPYSKVYQSRDNGITWKTNSSYILPKELNTAATTLAAEVDGDWYIWLVAAGTGEIWRGRLNRLGWEYQ